MPNSERNLSPRPRISLPWLIGSFAALLVSVAVYQLQVPAQLRNAQPTGEYVVIEREPAVLIPAKEYQIPLALAPIKQTDLISTVDGHIQSITAKTGDAIKAQAEALRMTDKELRLQVAAAKAGHEAAEAEVALAKAGKNADAIKVAEAKEREAKAELELAKLRADRAVIRAPFAGKVFRIHVVDDQWVRAGETLAVVGDVTKLHVEVPVDRDEEAIAEGKPLKLMIEDETVEGTIQHIFPPTEDFEPLRDLVDSVATAVVVIDNKDNKYAVGQTVHSPLIPRHPVVEVAKAAMKSAEDGTWTLQVIRKNVVQDVKVSPLGRVGEERMFVSGPFAEADEVITKTSKELPAGTQVTPDPLGRPTPQGTRVRRPDNDG